MCAHGRQKGQDNVANDNVQGDPLEPHVDGKELQVDGEQSGLAEVECEKKGNDAHPHHLFPHVSKRSLSLSLRNRESETYLEDVLENLGAIRLPALEAVGNVRLQDAMYIKDAVERGVGNTTTPCKEQEGIADEQ